MSNASDSYANPQKRIFANTEALDEALAQYVEEALWEAVGSRGRASLVVSGGSTPRGFFKRLADKPLPWQKIEVTLADERWVPVGSPGMEVGDKFMPYQVLLLKHDGSHEIYADIRRPEQQY